MESLPFITLILCMCGIAGALGFVPSLDPDVVGTFIHSLAHRGPDDCGFWSNTDDEYPSVALAHRRLSIQDLSQAGHQPMSSPCGRYVIVFNGEIYNQSDLRSSLETLGVHFNSTSDTEVLLHLLIIYGESAVAMLRGMYAFCFWDQIDRRAILARDPYGIKPLYYWIGPKGQLLFASEVRALLNTGLIPRELGIEGLRGFLLSGSIPEPFTLVKDILSLPPGWMGIWRNNHWHQEPHWRPSFNYSYIQDYNSLCHYTHSCLSESANLHLVGDVPIGIFLSGGLDSSALLALTCNSSISALSIGFHERQFDESSRSESIARHFGVNHKILRLSVFDAASLLPGFLDSVDQPSIDGFNTYCVSNLAASQGFKVVISGLGGDELFGGYPSFQKIPRLLRLHRFLGPSRFFVAANLESSPSHRLRRLASFLSGPLTPFAAHVCVRGLFSQSETLTLLRAWGLNSEGSSVVNPRSDLFDFHSTSIDGHFSSLADSISWLESYRYMGQQLLRDSDVYSMANGLELRIPFVDSFLFRQLSGISSEYRLAKGKQLLRDSMHELNGVVPPAPKKGFTLPFSVWFDEPRSPLRPGSEGYKLVSTPKTIDLAPWPRRWGLMVLNYWLQTHLNLAI